MRASTPSPFPYCIYTVEYWPCVLPQRLTTKTPCRVTCCYYLYEEDKNKTVSGTHRLNHPFTGLVFNFSIPQSMQSRLTVFPQVDKMHCHPKRGHYL